jgi:hypothetical protein
MKKRKLDPDQIDFFEWAAKRPTVEGDQRNACSASGTRSSRCSGGPDRLAGTEGWPMILQPDRLARFQMKETR